MGTPLEREVLYCHACIEAGRDPNPKFYIDGNGCERCPHDGAAPQSEPPSTEEVPEAVPTWVCPQCNASGEGLPPEECPSECGWYFDDYSSNHLTEAGFKQAIRFQKWLKYRAEAVADLLDFGHASIDFEYADRTDGTFTVKWESRNCSRGCCGSSEHEEDIPSRYLWMSDAAIKAELAEKKAAAAKAQAEKEHAAKLKAAHIALEQAAAAQATAQAKADESLARARAELSALTWRGP